MVGNTIPLKLKVCMFLDYIVSLLPVANDGNMLCSWKRLTQWRFAVYGHVILSRKGKYYPLESSLLRLLIIRIMIISIIVETSVPLRSYWLTAMQLPISLHLVFKVTSSNENIFRVTVPLYREFSGHRWIPLTKASDAALWCFLWSSQMVQ